jgi:hypothetical protein
MTNTEFFKNLIFFIKITGNICSFVKYKPKGRSYPFLSGLLLFYTIVHVGVFIVNILTHTPQTFISNDFQMISILIIYIFIYNFYDFTNYLCQTKTMKYFILPINSIRRAYSVLLYIEVMNNENLNYDHTYIPIFATIISLSCNNIYF